MIITPIAVDSDAGRSQMARLANRFQAVDATCQQQVADIIAQVRARGDEALLEYTRQFDAPEITLSQLQVTTTEIEQAYTAVDAEFRATLALAVSRIKEFHEHEQEESWMMTRDDGVITGRLVRPVDSAGLYVPGGTGGRTPLVSSVLMNGLPAAIAGVAKRVMLSPPDAAGRLNPALLVAANEIGISEIYKAGSAWAIAALAYGTKTIPRVDVIVGPGNRYVAEAKNQVAGMVRIDMIAGPSEVLIVADHTADPVYVAADMLAQAEHDPQALAMVVTNDANCANQIVAALETQLATLARQDIARSSLEARGVILVVTDIAEAIGLANQLAPEHLEMMVEDPWQWLPRIKHAGAIFLGHHAPEAVGDYLAGPNHVLPTMGTARFSSALGVETFIKKSSIIAYSQAAFVADAPHIRRLATLEGLTGHAQSVAIRQPKSKS